MEPRLRIRETDEIGGYAVEVVQQMLEEDETQRAGIPKDPALIALREDKNTSDPSFYDQFLTRNDIDEDVRKQTEAHQAEARAYQREREAWHPHYQRAIEYPASRIFVALRGGSLSAKGQLLPGDDIDEAFSELKANDRDVFDIPLTEIPQAFWSLQGIDFEASAASNGTHRYCHKPAPRLDTASMTFRRSRVERARRSSCVTTTTSPDSQAAYYLGQLGPVRLSP